MSKRTSNDDAPDGLEKIMRALLFAQIGTWTQREQIVLLDRAGFGQTEIARMLGTTTNAIGVRLTEIRRRARAKNRKK